SLLLLNSLNPFVNRRKRTSYCRLCPTLIMLGSATNSFMYSYILSKLSLPQENSLCSKGIVHPVPSSQDKDITRGLAPLYSGCNVFVSKSQATIGACFTSLVNISSTLSILSTNS